MSDQQRGGAHRVKPTEPGVGAAMCHSGISLVQIDENWSDFNSGDKKTPTFRFRQFFASNGHVVVSFWAASLQLVAETCFCDLC